MSVLLFLFCLGCDPQGPAARGQLAASRDVKVEAGRTLEIRAFPDDGKRFDPASANVSSREWRLRGSWPLSEVTFPFDYRIGGGLGNTRYERWLLVAWIAESENVERPHSGEWYGTRSFNLPKCGLPFGGFCGTAFHVDVEINARANH